MILICSNEEEPTTDLVCEWLNFYNKKFIRFSSKDKIKIKKVLINSMEGGDIYFELKGQNMKLSDVNSYWYRRSKLSFYDELSMSKEEIRLLDDYNFAILNINISEYKNIISFFKAELDLKSKLNKFSDTKINKLKILNQAARLGLNIPQTIIGKNELDFKDLKGESTITKAIGDIIFEFKNKSYGLMTNKIEINSSKCKEEFFYTLLQNQVEKKLELRIFYLDNTFYSTAIFSQSSDLTKVDFRNYDLSNPNRVVPYKLPIEIEDKLSNLFEEFDLKSGSVDMALTLDDKYIFFEINPIGQFEQVSFPSNYYLHKKIAEIL